MGLKNGTPFHIEKKINFFFKISVEKVFGTLNKK